MAKGEERRAKGAFWNACDNRIDGECNKVNRAA